MISIHDSRAVEQFCHELGIDRHCLRLLRNTWYKRFANRDEALAEIPISSRVALAAAVVFDALRLEGRQDSRLDGASKLLFRTTAGLLVETVILRIASGRTSVCVSSQVGCAAGCAFCATARMGIARHLSVSEILDQVLQAGRIARSEGRRVRNVVFMGMGEPFHNEPAVHAALDALHDPALFELSPRHTLISTVGIPEAMVRCARRYPRVGLALSLHSARQDVREQFVPLARRFRLSDLRAAIEEVNASQQRPVMIEYLLLRGVNDGAEDLTALIDYLRGLRVAINLIPFNPVPSAPQFQSTPPAERARFAALLRASGFQVTQRYSLGPDIAAACGQLAQPENRRLALASARI